MTEQVKNPEYAEYDKRYEGKSIQDLARAMKALGDRIDELDEQRKELNREYDFLRFTLLPRVMEDQDVSLMKIDGLGRLGTTSDINCSIKSGAKEQAYVWLQDHGHGDLIQPTVNSSSLKAAIKKAMADGVEVPAELFNVAPFTRATITKTAK